MSDMREDYETLSVGLGLSDDEMRKLGLYDPASGSPADMAEAYIRRSNKREDVAALRGQLRDVIAMFQANGLACRHVWLEQLSASKKSVTRREYQKALDAVLSGKSKTLGVWKLDRFDRQGAGSVLGAVDRLDERNCRLLIHAERLDSSQKGSRTFIALFAERAKEEAEDIALRVQNGHRSHKAMGRRGTGRPPFGLQSPPGSGVVEHNPDEYATARAIAEMVLAGKNTVEAAYKANELGYRTRSGATWSSTAVAKLVQSPVFAGMVPQRERRVDEYGNKMDSWKGYGEPVYDEQTGEPMTCGEGVITPMEFFKIRSLIRSRTNPFTQRGKRFGTYVATETLRCGRCNGAMHGGGGKYYCATRETRGPAVCAGVVTTAERLDAALSLAWVEHVTSMEPDSPELYEIGIRLMRFNDPETDERATFLRESLANAEGRLQELSDHYWNPPSGAYRMRKEDYERQARKLDEMIAGFRQRVAELSQRSDVSALLDPELLTEAYKTADLAMKRVLMKAVWPNGVTVLPATGRGDQRPISDRLVFPEHSGDDATLSSDPA